jgi:uncharacterized protein (TIGR02246 family)
MRFSPGVAGACVLLLAGCQPKPVPFNPVDPVALAQIDSLMQPVLDGAQNADADKVMSFADAQGDFTFVSGDMMLSGVPQIREDFRATYANVAHQDHKIISRRIRLLTPDVALYTVVGEGTYTDKAGWTSPPVGLGLTVVLVKKNGKWVGEHAHQSVAF